MTFQTTSEDVVVWRGQEGVVKGEELLATLLASEKQTRDDSDAAEVNLTALWAIWP